MGLPEEGRELDDRSRFKITLQLANTVNLQNIVDFCKREKSNTLTANTVVSHLRFPLDLPSKSS